jgi:hypothetical protein
MRSGRLLQHSDVDAVTRSQGRPHSAHVHQSDIRRGPGMMMGWLGGSRGDGREVSCMDGSREHWCGHCWGS